ncbi:DeoR family transcriptional regulator [Kitasatospora sp. NPDC094019]|uniref:DeoR family transcriptional regulator n=1 Tax=Kitasatospora sp. NPDC094019 TaxID=3364091 RepID=UPI00380BBD06
MAMSREERRRLIVTAVGDLGGQVRLKDLADRLGIPAVTVRRDVAALADAGRLARSHGFVSLDHPGPRGGGAPGGPPPRGPPRRGAPPRRGGGGGGGAPRGGRRPPPRGPRAPPPGPPPGPPPPAGPDAPSACWCPRSAPTSTR